MTSHTIDEKTVEIRNNQVEIIAPDPHAVSLVEILTQFAYRKALIAKITGGAILVSVTISLLLPVRYTAATKIMPPQQSPSTASLLMGQLTSLGGGSLAAIAAGSGAGLGLKSPSDIYIGFLNSRPVADAIIKKFDLMKLYDTKDMTATRRKLADLTVVTSEKSGLISVAVTDGDKGRAASMANAYTDELRKLTKTLAVGEAGQRRLFYEEQLKQAKESLVEAEFAFQKIQQQKGLVQLDAQARAMVESLSYLRAQVAAKRVEIQSLRTYSTDQNPAVQLAEKDLTSLQAEVSRLERNNPGAAIDSIGLQNIPAAGLEYLRAEHELRYEQALYDILLRQYDAARLDESKEGTVIQIVEPAIAPDRKSSPKRAVIVVISTVCGFFMGCFLAITLWWREIINSEPLLYSQFHELKSALSLKRETKMRTR